MQSKIIERYFFFSLLLLTIVFTVFIFRPFLSVLVIGASFSVVLYPVYAWLKKKRFPDWLAALSTVIGMIVVIGAPLFGISTIVFNQSQNVYRSVVEGRDTGAFVSSINSSINSVLPEGIVFDLGEKASDFISLISNNIASVFTSTLSAIFALILTILTIFYFLKDGARWRKVIVTLSPLSDVDDEKIINRLSRAINGIIKGSLFIAVVQGILMGVGLMLFGVPNPALWGLVAAVTSLVPTIGTALVSIPAILFLLATGQTPNAIGLIIWAVVVVGMVDNFLSPFIVGKKISIPPILILFSVLGGISLIGPVGGLIGPLSVSLLYTLVSIYRTDFKKE